ARKRSGIVSVPVAAHLSNPISTEKDFESEWSIWFRQRVVQRACQSWQHGIAEPPLLEFARARALSKSDDRASDRVPT
ncbi:MAG TPA: hypothetical protein PKD61_33695, partial [Polyangiaceae bacterium]|nr:hypothetical protein [Polyangiaceae bacterium]